LVETDQIKIKIKKQYKKLVAFEKKHNLIHNQANKRNFHNWAELLVSIGHCPCRPERSECPCKEALTEITEIGHCACVQFFRNENGNGSKKEKPILSENLKVPS